MVTTLLTYFTLLSTGSSGGEKFDETLGDAYDEAVVNQVGEDLGDLLEGELEHLVTECGVCEEGLSFRNHSLFHAVGCSRVKVIYSDDID